MKRSTAWVLAVPVLAAAWWVTFFLLPGWIAAAYEHDPLWVDAMFVAMILWGCYLVGPLEGSCECGKRLDVDGECNRCKNNTDLRP